MYMMLAPFNSLFTTTMDPTVAATFGNAVRRYIKAEQTKRILTKTCVCVCARLCFSFLISLDCIRRDVYVSDCLWGGYLSLSLSLSISFCLYVLIYSISLENITYYLKNRNNFHFHCFSTHITHTHIYVYSYMPQPIWELTNRLFSSCIYHVHHFLSLTLNLPVMLVPFLQYFSTILLLFCLFFSYSHTLAFCLFVFLSICYSTPI